MESKRTSNRKRPQKPREQKSHHPTLAQLAIGEPDANQEYYIARKRQDNPLYSKYYFSPDAFSEQDFISGEKYFLIGQKGTGKTAIFRYLEQVSKDEYRTQFIVFKKTIIEEAELLSFGELPVVDDSELKGVKHYFHVIKRLILFLIAREITFGGRDLVEADIEDSDRGWLQKLAGSSPADVVKLAFSSAYDLLRAFRVSAGAASNEVVKAVEQAKFLKKNNDSLNRYIISRARASHQRMKIFFDEVHFSYRDEAGVRTDAMLVRDLLHVASSMNDAFADAEIDITIYVSVRQEFLQHPIIKNADIVHSIESSGFLLDWSEFIYDRRHPLFDLIHKRLISEDGRSVSPFSIIANMSAESFLEYTWAKPRDLIRFFSRGQNNVWKENDSVSAKH